ncbi:MAG TPA: hypothetical protein VN920_12365 [Pyrinomonadaceae bacterium]|nr:hypothetical protein [Pyrinomonadaceae bacterium]
MDEKVTKATIEAVLERMNAMEDRLGSRISASEERIGVRINALEERVNAFEERLGTRLDRIESLAHPSRAEGLELRADFRDLRKQLREHLPTLN